MDATAKVIQLLKDKRADLIKQVGSRDEIQVEKLADPIDICTAQAQRDAAASNINRANALLREVTMALGRALDGSFGICVDCEEDIPAKRLEAIPWAARCVPCETSYQDELLTLGEPKRLESKRGILTEGYDGFTRRNRHLIDYI